MNITSCLKKSSSTNQPCIKVLSNGEKSKNKKFSANYLSMKKNSHNRPLKNKTIPENVRQGTNNFRKSSVASTKNMSKCLKQFIFIMDMRWIFDALNIGTVKSMGP